MQQWKGSKTKLRAVHDAEFKHRQSFSCVCLFCFELRVLHTAFCEIVYLSTTEGNNYIYLIVHKDAVAPPEIRTNSFQLIPRHYVLFSRFAVVMVR